MATLELIRDFVNTTDLESGEDELVDAAGLQHWLVGHGLARERDRATAADAAAARAVREALRELLREHTGVAVDRDAASATLDAAARRARLDLRFSGAEIRFVPRSGGIAGGLGLVLAAVGEAIADGSWPLLKACRSDTCRWAFIDSSRNASRRWCDMALCGNRSKARAFRRRSRA